MHVLRVLNYVGTFSVFRKNNVCINFQGHEENAGWIGVTLVVSGVFGSVIAGLWLDKTKLFK